MTSYAVQGATFDVSTSRIDEGASRAEAYVDITRGRNANHLFITRAADPLDGEHLPKAPAPPLHDSVADRLHRSGPERAAIEFAVGPSTAAARFLAHRPPSGWASRFPEQADDPVYLRSRGRAALEAVLAYRSRWHPAPDQGDGWAWALGQVPLNPDARTEREAAIEVLDLFARAMITEALGADRAPHWTADQLMRALRSGVSRSDLRPLIGIGRALEHGHGSATTHAPSDATDWCRSRIFSASSPTPSGSLVPVALDSVSTTRHRRLPQHEDSNDQSSDHFGGAASSAGPTQTD